MFEVLVYLFESYLAPEACPDIDTLAKKLSAVGFENEEIGDALSWLKGLAEMTEHSGEELLRYSQGSRVYTPQECQTIGMDGISFIAFLESAEVLPPPLREIVIDRCLALKEAPVMLDKLKIIVLMVLWSQEADIDNLILEELLDDGSARQLH